MEVVQDYVKKRSFLFWGRTPFSDLFPLLEMLFPYTSSENPVLKNFKIYKPDFCLSWLVK